MNRNQVTVLINISRDSAGMVASGIELPQGRKKKKKEKKNSSVLLAFLSEIKLRSRIDVARAGDIYRNL